MHHFLFHEEGTKQKPSRQGTQFDNGEKHLIRGSPWPDGSTGKFIYFLS